MIENEKAVLILIGPLSWLAVRSKSYCPYRAATAPNEQSELGL